MVLNRNYGPGYILHGENSQGIPVTSLVFTIIIIGIFLGITSSLFEFNFAGKKFGGLSHGVAILLKTSSYIFLLLLAGSIAYFNIEYLDVEFKSRSTLTEFLFSFNFLPIFLYMIFTSLFINVLIHVERIIGRKNLIRFVSGKYLKPVEEERIFMFIDLNDSTKLAEKWGHIKMSAYLQEFFADLSELIIPYQGEIYQFVGDEAVVTWPLKRNKEENANCLQLYYAFREHLAKKKSCYNEQFGQIPDFKAGINCGTVVVSEVGKYKVELAYHGDVMNTTARMTSQCRILEKPVLVSEAMYNAMDCNNYEVESIGDAQFRGKEKYTSLYYIYPKSDKMDTV